MGLLSPNYNKPGPGVDKDAPPKPRFFVFFEVFKRKFWNLMKVNLMFVLFNILALAAAYYVSAVLLQRIRLDGGMGDIVIRLFLAAILTLIPVVTTGPVQAGFTYVLRNYSREEHSFIWGDFKENLLRNFKQGMIIAIIDIFAMIVFSIALNVYSSMSGILPVLGATFIFISIIIFFMMHLYIYPMLVTVNLNIKNLYKNALIFSIMKFIPNFLMILLNLIIAFLAFYIPFVGVVLYILILPAFMGLMNNFYVNPLIKKYVAMPDEGNGNKEESIFEDNKKGESFYKPAIEDEDKNI
ncbi:putative membrane protein YesL [Ruminiclostridium sufflavum DSM 19573]|uniref:Putative membrane protein YesL n=1 Tax=Ruminiclostridium sufflavum DSM 19573 TaxID=1121337 RepID=A0A318XKM2_9FIRM|nr:YesL family protein [Ruminiclostridium sufflavum]PYG87008.1 putative membrane protein YesL [Ruminiclostridium sufflavum DSM 19573]